MRLWYLCWCLVVLDMSMKKSSHELFLSDLSHSIIFFILHFFFFFFFSFLLSPSSSPSSSPPPPPPPLPPSFRYTSRRIMLFVVVFLVLWTCPTFFRMHEMFVGAPPKTGYPKWLLTTVKCLFGLNGLMNCLVWTTSRPFQVVYERTRCCCCCRIFSDATRNKRGSDDSYLLDEDSLGGAGSATRGGSAVLYRTATEEWSQDKDES